VVAIDGDATLGCLTFKLGLGHEGVGGTQGYLVSDKNKLRGNVKEKCATTVLLSGRLKSLCGGKVAMHTRFILVCKNTWPG